jgi:hypothetical protein
MVEKADQSLSPPRFQATDSALKSDHREALGHALYFLAAGSLTDAGPQRNSSPRDPRARRLLVCLQSWKHGWMALELYNLYYQLRGNQAEHIHELDLGYYGPG